MSKIGDRLHAALEADVADLPPGERLLYEAMVPIEEQYLLYGKEAGDRAMEAALASADTGEPA